MNRHLTLSVKSNETSMMHTLYILQVDVMSNSKPEALAIVELLSLSVGIR